ncbi:MAG: hypothetical protein ABJB12_04265 [Pseudomonadota bacterium]
MKNNQMSAFTSGAAGLCLAVCLGACAAGQQQAQAPSATTTDEVVTFTVPNVKPVQQGSESQTQKQIIVSVVPKAFMVSDEAKKECVQGADAPSGGLLGGLIKVDNGQVAKKSYVVTTRTGVNYEPKTLTFVLRFMNNSGQVMHLGDLYLTVNVNGQEVEVSQLDVGKIKSGVLLAGKETEFAVSVPSWQHDADATVDFSLQNVPIEIDKAGIPSERGKFQWTFVAKMETKQAQSKKTVENLMLDAAEAASLSCHPGAVAAN